MNMLGDVLIDNEAPVYVDFVSLDDLPNLFLKMLIEGGLARLYSLGWVCVLQVEKIIIICFKIRAKFLKGATRA